MSVSKQFNFLWIVIFSLFQNTYAAGDLTRQNPIEIKIDMRSSGESHFFSPSLIRLETSKLYKIVLKNVYCEYADCNCSDCKQYLCVEIKLHNEFLFLVRLNMRKMHVFLSKENA